MRQGEIVQCQGYMGARAQNRPYAEERRGGSVEGRVEEVKKEERGREVEEQEARRCSGRGEGGPASLGRMLLTMGRGGG